MSIGMDATSPVLLPEKGGLRTLRQNTQVSRGHFPRFTHLCNSQAGNVFMISEGIPKNPFSYLMGDIDSVTTEYVPASRVKSLLPEFPRARVKVNEGKNAAVLSAPSQMVEKIQGVDVGTRISVSPWTGGNGEITTTISPEVSNIVELDRTTGLPNAEEETKIKSRMLGKADSPP